MPYKRKTRDIYVLYGRRKNYSTPHGRVAAWTCYNWERIDEASEYRDILTLEREYKKDNPLNESRIQKHRVNTSI